MSSKRKNPALSGMFISGLQTLEEIPHPGLATSKHWKDYPEEIHEHPARNHPMAVAWLIEQYSQQGNLVWDPMAGAGTVPIEARRLNRVGYGCDVHDRWQNFLAEWEMLRNAPEPGTVDLVVTSPSFFDTNHHHGRTEVQVEYTKRMSSRAGAHYDEGRIDGHMGQLGAPQEPVFWWLLGNVFQKITVALKPGGYVVVILRDKVRKGKIYPFTKKNAVLLRYMGLSPDGAHPREIPKTARWQQREKLKPGQIHIGVEWALVFRKPRED